MSRNCSRCTVCCKLQGIMDGMPDGEPKLPGVRCQYLSRKKRDQHTPCRIYAERPEECKSYSCLWLQGIGIPKDRPDRLGVLFEVQDQEGTVFVLARTTRRGNDESPRAKILMADIWQQVPVAVVHPDQVQGWRNEMDIEDRRTETVRLPGQGVSKVALARSWNTQTRKG